MMETIELIPKPLRWEERYGEFVFHAANVVYAPDAFERVAEELIELVEEACGFRMERVASEKAEIRFLPDHHLPEEGYRLECKPEELLIYASTERGARYALESVRQLTLADRLKDANMLTMHAMLIEDAPKYRWRGLMLDEARHFFGPEVFRRVVDRMARMKLNVLHWHLSDNEGWRIEIKKYPFLTSVGSVRKGTQSMAWGSKAVDYTPMKGFYTQEEIKEAVRYAASKGIMVVPEIDMPAHMGAAMAAYPELSCRGEKGEPAVFHNDPVSTYTACVGKAETFKVLYDILDEVTALFPAPYFHIGGDEAPKGEWKKCEKCQALMKERGLKTEAELQGYFTNKIAVYLAGKGKKVIGWNEILGTGELQKDIVVQYWTLQRDKRAEAASREGRKIIVSKHQACYFDMPYAQNSLKKTYLVSAEYCRLKDDGNVLGFEGELWTEWVLSEGRMWFQYLPRMIALAEAAWSKEKDYRDFKQRLERYLSVLEKDGLDYAPPALWDKKGIGALRTQAKFLATDAHCEYNRYLKLKKGRKKRQKS